MPTELIDVKEAAVVLGIAYQTLLVGLKQGCFAEFGTAVECKKTWRYIIFKKRFEAYINAEDLKSVHA
jgi:hypothetical protein